MSPQTFLWLLNMDFYNADQDQYQFTNCFPSHSFKSSKCVFFPMNFQMLNIFFADISRKFTTSSAFPIKLSLWSSLATLTYGNRSNHKNSHLQLCRIQIPKQTGAHTKQCVGGSGQRCSQTLLPLLETKQRSKQIQQMQLKIYVALHGNFVVIKASDQHFKGKAKQLLQFVTNLQTAHFPPYVLRVS